MIGPKNSEDFLSPPIDYAKIIMAKHKTEVMREMLHTTDLINLDDISLHSSDDSDIISSTEKKLSEFEQQMDNQIS